VNVVLWHLADWSGLRLPSYSGATQHDAGEDINWAFSSARAVEGVCRVHKMVVFRCGI
jgi:hypothetical protein